MPIEIIGSLLTNRGSEISPGGPLVDRPFLRRFAQASEAADFDRVLVTLTSVIPDPLPVTVYAAAHTERLGFLIAHRPGFVQPTVTARQFATLDELTGGRVALHAISGGIEAEQRRDGDYLDKSSRYQRTGEYLRILKRAWTATDPFDHDGRFYRIRAAAPTRPYQQPRIPIYFAGSSPQAYQVGGAEADVHAFFGQPLDQIAEEIRHVRAGAQAAGRVEGPRVSVSFRVILGATEEVAWERARQILAVTRQRLAQFGAPKELDGQPAEQPAVGFQRQLRAAERGEHHGRALWTALATATGYGGNKIALVGTPDTVAGELARYVDLGVSTVLLSGFELYDDTVTFGRELIPLLRQEVAHRDRRRLAGGHAPLGAATVGGAGWRSTTS
ncbi:alkanesulfonate monooxygenase [Frankia sp. AiPs1]|uniref:LLM class flavin-dependent oxidoreductase n=1 Tax=Frankia sp. AiPa1 TaxID=573492 RepID=UPI00202ACCFE|nr:LLM class flavin-dependent oxidoreductase [Frankia sp. AiPa1]MCL9760176.1 LLM class flavin-dependent oxidoreductase [Frankia sp. AiPa1]